MHYCEINLHEHLCWMIRKSTLCPWEGWEGWRYSWAVCIVLSHLMPLSVLPIVPRSAILSCPATTKSPSLVGTVQWTGSYCKECTLHWGKSTRMTVLAPLFPSTGLTVMYVASLHCSHPQTILLPLYTVQHTLCLLWMTSMLPNYHCLYSHSLHSLYGLHSLVC